MEEDFIESANNIIKEDGYCDFNCNKCPLFKNGKCIAEGSVSEDMHEKRDRKVAFAKDYLKDVSNSKGEK